MGKRLAPTWDALNETKSAGQYETRLLNTHGNALLEVFRCPGNASNKRAVRWGLQWQSDALKLFIDIGVKDKRAQEIRDGCLEQLMHIVMGRFSVRERRGLDLIEEPRWGMQGGFGRIGLGSGRFGGM